MKESQGPLKNRRLLGSALNASLQWEISEHIISNVIMVTLSKECPLVLQINRGSLLFSLRGASWPDNRDLFSSVRGAKRACNGQTDPRVLWPSKGKRPHVLKVLDKCPKWTPGTMICCSKPWAAAQTVVIVFLLLLLCLSLHFYSSSLPSFPFSLLIYVRSALHESFLWINEHEQGN